MMKKEDIFAVLLIIVFYAGMQCMGITCPIKYITGISCAGCGMTRAWISFLRGDVMRAMYYHPLFWLVIPAAIGYICRKYIPKKYYISGIIIFILLFMGTYAYRLLWKVNDVVVFCPKEGIIYKVFYYFL